MPTEMADYQLQRKVSVADSVSRMSMGENMSYQKGAVAARMAEQDPNLSAQAAQMIILHIMESLEGLDDLFSFAVVNKGFYRVFKKHELKLVRKTLRNQCPPAWEYRETALTTVTDGSETPNEDRPTPEYTPQTYYECYKRDCTVIDMLKKLLMQHCKSFLRVSTVAALASKDLAKSVRVDAALWRVWNFCTIFGNGRAREDDITAQLDWLRGGTLVHQDTCTSTIVSQDSFFLSSILLSAPEHFAIGNNTNNGEKDGLSAEELYDITELWGAIPVLVQTLDENTDLARAFGVYDSTDIEGGDIDGEEHMLGKSASLLR